MSSQPQSFIHYDPTRIDYTLSQSELDALVNASSNNWKDFFLGCIGVAVPCLLNAFTIYLDPAFQASKTSFVLNLVIGAVTFTLGMAFFRAWRKSATDVAAIVAAIKGKPRIPFAPTLRNVGAIEAGGDEPPT